MGSTMLCQDFRSERVQIGSTIGNSTTSHFQIQDSEMNFNNVGFPSRQSITRENCTELAAVYTDNGKLSQPPDHNPFLEDGVDESESFVHSRKNEPPLHLTPFILKGQLAQGRNEAKVDMTKFKAAKGSNLEKIESYAGYFTVDEARNHNLFFWFFPAEKKSGRSAPVLLWLQGGPGASGMFGLFKLHGPIDAFTEDNTIKIKRKKVTWTKDYNVIYVDSPIKTGFSYGEGYLRTLKQVTEELYQLQVQFFQLFPMYKNNQFYVTGESYAGKYCPDLAVKIHQENERQGMKINMAGVIIGNGWMSPIDQAIRAEFVYQAGLIDVVTKDKCLKIEEIVRTLIREERWKDAQFCNIKANSLVIAYTKDSYIYDLRNTTRGDDFYAYKKFCQMQTTRSAIHVGSRQYQTSGSKVFDALRDDIMMSAKQNIEFLLKYYRVLVYNGNMDTQINPAGYSNFLHKLQWSGSKQFRRSITARYYSNNKRNLYGYIKKHGNLYHLTIRNAGHFVPFDQPKVALKMIHDFTRNKL